MLLKLLPEQVSSNWNWIKFALVESTPELTEYGLNVILENLLGGGMQCWWEVSYTTEDIDDFKLHAVVVTTTFYDTFFQMGCLRICNLYGYVDLAPQQWIAGVETLKAYARGLGLHRIEAFTQHKGLFKLVEKLGVNVDYHLTVEV